MDTSTRKALIRLNRRFYRHHAIAFSDSRQHGWRGWEPLLAWLPSGETPLKVLDVGCGNGRFALWLLRNERRIDLYFGIDQSVELIAEARRGIRLLVGELRVARFITQDVVGNGLRTISRTLPGFDCAALMAVLHHVPGRLWRRRLLIETAQSVTHGGILVVSLWRFDRAPGWQKKQIPGSPVLFDLSDLEDGDHLLTFGGDEQHPRYCHLIDDLETTELIDAVLALGKDWFLADRHDADGRSGADNHYLIFKRR